MIRFMFPEGDCDDRSMAYWAGDTPVAELRLQRDPGNRAPAIEATATLNGEKVHVLFDTGATSVLTLSAAHRAGVTDAEMQPDGTVYGVGRGKAKAWVAPIRRFEIGGETISNNQLQVAEFALDDIDMLVGIDFFLSHRIYI